MCFRERKFSVDWVTGSLLLGASALAVEALKRWVHAPLADRDTGAKRRRLVPLRDELWWSHPFSPPPSEFKVERHLHQHADGFSTFYAVVTPNAKKPKAVVVFFHGWNDNAENKLPLATVLAVRLQTIVIVPDLPSHGFSDGLMGYIPSYHGFVRRISDNLESVLPPLRAATASLQTDV